MAEQRSRTSDDAPGSHCIGGEGGSARFHEVEGSGRELLEGMVVTGDDSTARFCTELETDGSCPDGSPAVPEVHDLGDQVLRGSFLARTASDSLTDVIYLPAGYSG